MPILEFIQHLFNFVKVQRNTDIHFYFAWLLYLVKVCFQICPGYTEIFVEKVMILIYFTLQFSTIKPKKSELKGGDR